jgi:hypothetical protein
MPFVGAQGNWPGRAGSTGLRQGTPAGEGEKLLAVYMFEEKEQAATNQPT